jgi:hypothetical protein
VSVRAERRAARWPWGALAAFVAFAVVGLVFVHVNGEGYADQIPFVIAFGVFGIVGAAAVAPPRVEDDRPAAVAGGLR